MKHTVSLVLTLSIALFLCNKSLCQSPPGKLDSIKSTILNEQRLFRVVLPEGYDPNQAVRYDVLYITDGEWNLMYITPGIKEPVRIPAEVQYH